MPGFDEKAFPHFFVTGASQICLGNLTTNKMETLILGSSKPYYANPGVIFLDAKVGDANDVTRFIYGSLNINKMNFAQYAIHEMTLYPDFKQALRRIGHLPEVTVAKVIELEEEN